MSIVDRGWSKFGQALSSVLRRMSFRWRTRRISVVYTPNKSYALPLTVSIFSLLENYGRRHPLDIYVMGEAFPEEEKNLLLQSVSPLLRGDARLVWLPCDTAAVSSLRAELHFDPVVYLRLLIPQVISEDLEHVLYLDCDTLILSDITPLFFEDVGGHVLLAAQDRVGWFNSPMVNLSGKLDKFRIPETDKYFNAGVLLFNLPVWRRENLSEKILEFCEENPELLFLADQNAINIYFHNRIGEIDFSWNCQSIWRPIREGAVNIPVVKNEFACPKLLHFVSAEKPWLPDCQIPERAEFVRYWRKTRWPVPDWVG